MTASSHPPVISPLSSTDSSAQITLNGYTILAAVNGPLEVQRRDELPEEALLEVSIRPANGSGGVKERHYETTIHNVLREIISVKEHPRTAIQVILQILAVPAQIPDHQSASNITLLPSLLQAAQLALLQSSIPLSGTLSANLLAVLHPASSEDSSIRVVAHPSAIQITKAESVHVVASKMPSRSMVLLESEGCFTIGGWKEVVRIAKDLCESDQKALKRVLQKEMDKEARWKLG